MATFFIPAPVNEPIVTADGKGIVRVSWQRFFLQLRNLLEFVATGLTSGAVPFGNSTGSLTQDATQLLWDEPNKRLGVTTATPATTIDATNSGLIRAGGIGLGGVPGGANRVDIFGATSGSISLRVPAIAGARVLTLPAATDTLVGLSTNDVLSNKTMVAPVLGVATATSINKWHFTATATSIVLTGTDNTTYTLPITGGSQTIGGLLAPATWLAAQTFSDAKFLLAGVTSGTMTLKAAAIAGTNTITFPAGTTDFSGTGGTSQVVKQSSAGAALTVGTLAVTDLSDFVAQAAFTPTDQSGAALAFTNVSCQSLKIGNLIWLYGTLTYPITVSGATAAISLPVAVPNTAYANAPGTLLVIGVAAGAIVAVQATSTANFDSGAGVLYTNANLSTQQLRFSLLYPAA